MKLAFVALAERKLQFIVDPQMYGLESRVCTCTVFDFSAILNVKIEKEILKYVSASHLSVYDLPACLLKTESEAQIVLKYH